MPIDVSSAYSGLSRRAEKSPVFTTKPTTGRSAGRRVREIATRFGVVAALKSKTVRRR